MAIYQGKWATVHTDADAVVWWLFAVGRWHSSEFEMRFNFVKIVAKLLKISNRSRLGSALAVLLSHPHRADDLARLSVGLGALIRAARS